MTNISPEAVKAFVSANAGVTDPVQRRLLDMLNELSAERDKLKNAASEWYVQCLEAQTERDTIKATVARLCEAAETLAEWFDDEDQEGPLITAIGNLYQAIAASKETLP